MPKQQPIQPNPNQTVGGIPNSAFGAAIPGQSLTREPGIYPFEHPPKFPDVDSAMESIMAGLQDPKHFNMLMNLLELDAPVHAIVGTLLMHGFGEGKWTPDVAMMMYVPLCTLVLKLAQEAGIQPQLGIQPDVDPTEAMVIQKKAQKLAQQVEQEMSEPETTGFMAPPKD
jgi:hypothetical protein